MKIDLSLTNTDIYDGCKIEEVAGRMNLATPPDEALNIMGRNLKKIIEKVPPTERTEVTLTGGMAVWAYLGTFHNVLHVFGKVYYEDGKGLRVLVAAHG